MQCPHCSQNMIQLHGGSNSISFINLITGHLYQNFTCAHCGLTGPSNLIEAITELRDVLANWDGSLEIAASLKRTHAILCAAAGIVLKD